MLVISAISFMLTSGKAVPGHPTSKEQGSLTAHEVHMNFFPNLSDRKITISPLILSPAPRTFQSEIDLRKSFGNLEVPAYFFPVNYGTRKLMIVGIESFSGRLAMFFVVYLSSRENWQVLDHKETWRLLAANADTPDLVHPITSASSASIVRGVAYVKSHGSVAIRIDLGGVGTAIRNLDRAANMF